MKKLFFILNLVLFSICVFSQENSNYDYKIGYDGTWQTYTSPSTTYATSSTDSIWYFTILKESESDIKYDIKLIVDSISGTNQITDFFLQGKIWGSDIYSNIDTVTWVTGVDTTFTFTTASTLDYRYYRIYVKSRLKGFIFQIDEYSTLFRK